MVTNSAIQNPWGLFSYFDQCLGNTLFPRTTTVDASAKGSKGWHNKRHKQDIFYYTDYTLIIYEK